MKNNKSRQGIGKNVKMEQLGNCIAFVSACPNPSKSLLCLKKLVQNNVFEASPVIDIFANGTIWNALPDGQIIAATVTDTRWLRMSDQG